MKKMPIAGDLSRPVAAALSGAWALALEEFQDDLRRRAMSDKTRHAYAIDIGQFARWSQGGELRDPAAIDVRSLRRYAAGLTASGSAPATVARKLAALRRFFRVQVARGHRDENLADLLISPMR